MAERPKIKLVQLLEDEIGEWRFYGVATNNRVIVESSEGYKNHLDAVGAILGVFGENVHIEEIPSGEGRDNMGEEQNPTPQGDEAPQEGAQPTPPQGDEQGQQQPQEGTTPQGTEEQA